MKKCFKCLEEKALGDFYKHSRMGDGHLNKCKDCTRKDVKANYQERIDQYRQYDKTRQRKSKRRILNHRYGLIRRRVEGRASRQYAVMGKQLLTFDEWSLWTELQMEEFNKIYSQWERSGFARALAPSIDRIDSDKSYTADNLQWLTVSENARKGTKKT